MLKPAVVVMTGNYSQYRKVTDLSILGQRKLSLNHSLIARYKMPQKHLHDKILSKIRRVRHVAIV